MIPKTMLEAIEAFKRAGINETQFKIIQQNAKHLQKMVSDSGVLNKFSDHIKIITKEAFQGKTNIPEDTYPEFISEKPQIPDPVLIDIIELNTQIKEIKSYISNIQNAITELKTGQTYLLWIIGLLFATGFPMGLGIIWKLFDLAKLIS